ncbi:unnamed protein product [Clonostachys solani]|uniref:C2H2-type domain-containing protein n=1 Tax=Clonostachys solani TaxID=160281 RepID=A0A9P0EJN6_9HYPO|nr:unnamed protein product [Clonostachys solani]
MSKRGVPMPSTPSQVGPVPKRNRPSARTESGISNDIPSDDVEATEAFACPFLKKDPVRHMACLSRKLKRIGDVKQHIHRRHLNDIVQCLTCNLTFGSSIDRDEHVNLSRCSSMASSATRQSISEKLRGRAPRGMSPTDMYSNLCDILFGKQERPLKPYLGPILLESNALLWNFWQSEKASLVQTAIKDQSAFTTPGDVSPMVLAIVDQLRIGFEQHVKALRLGEIPNTPASMTLSNTQEEILQANPFSMQIFGYNQTSDVSFEAQLPTAEGSHNSMSLLATAGTAMNDDTSTFLNTIDPNNSGSDPSSLRRDEPHSSAEILFGPEAGLSTNLDFDSIFKYL